MFDVPPYYLEETVRAVHGKWDAKELGGIGELEGWRPHMK